MNIGVKRKTQDFLVGGQLVEITKVKPKVLRNEIDILNPSVIVFYTSQDYDEFIFGKDLFDDVSLVTEIENRKIIGAKRMPWTEAIGKKAEKNIDILRVGHPERMKKEDYVDSISSWIKEKGISE